MAKAEKKRHGGGILLGVAVVLLLGVLGLQLHQLKGQVADAEAQKALLQAQVQEKQQENDALQRDIDQGGSQDVKERIARDELGEVSPGEKVFYYVGN